MGKLFTAYIKALICQLEEKDRLEKEGLSSDEIRKHPDYQQVVKEVIRTSREWEDRKE